MEEARKPKNEIVKSKDVAMTKNESTMVDKFIRAARQQLRAKNAPKIIVNGIVVRMPLELILSRAKFTQMELNIMTTVMKVIGSKVAHELETETLGSLFSKEEFGENPNAIRFIISEKEFGYPKKYKADLRDAIKLMVVVPIEIPVIGKKTEQVYHKYTNLCSINEPERQNESDPYYVVEMNRDVAEHITNSNTDYANIIEIANKKMKSKYSIKMYMFTVAICGQDSISFTFEYLRDQFSKGIERHKKYSEFEKEVLVKSQQDIQRLYNDNLLDYWFEYSPTSEERVELKQRNNPDEVTFIFHRRNELPSFEKKKTRISAETKNEIESKLVKEFGLFPTSAKEIVSKLNMGNIEAFDKKVQQVREDLASGKAKKDGRSYAFVAFNKFFFESAGVLAEAKEIKDEKKTETISSSASTEYVNCEDLSDGVEQIFCEQKENLSSSVGTGTNRSSDMKGKEYWKEQWYNCKTLMERYGYDIALSLSHLMTFESYDEKNRILRIQIPGPTTEVQELIERKLKKMVMWHITNYFPSDVTIEYTIIKFVKPSDVDGVRQLNLLLQQQEESHCDIMDFDGSLFNPKDEHGMPIDKVQWKWNYAMKLVLNRVGEQNFNDIFSKLELFRWKTEPSPEGKFIKLLIMIPSREFFDTIEEKENVSILSQALNWVFRCRISIEYQLPPAGVGV